MPYDIKLVAYNPSGARIGELPQPLSIESADPLSDAPSMTVKYSKHSIGAEILKQPVEIAREVYDPGTDTWMEPTNGRFLNIRTEGDQLDSTGALNYVLPGYSWLLSKISVYPIDEIIISGQIQDAEQTESGYRTQLNAAEDALCVELKKSKNTRVIYGDNGPSEHTAIWVNTSSWDTMGTAVPYLYINNQWEEIWDGYVQGDPTGQVLATNAYAIYLDHQTSQGQLRDTQERAKLTKRSFAGMHAGAVLAQLMDEAIQRGNRLPGLARSFTATHDSAGNPWPSVPGNIEVNVGSDLLKVLLSFVRSGQLDFRTNGRELQLYIQDTAMKRDNTANAVFRYGVHIDEAPDRGTWENLANEILFIGDEGLTFTRSNPEAPTPWGMWEGSVSQSGVDSESVGDLLARHALEEAAGRRVERTRALIFRDDIAGPFPYMHYLPGDTIMAPNSDGEMEAQRVQQITLTKDGSTGRVSGNIVLNDRFIEREIRNQRTTEALTGGTALGGTGGTREQETYVDRRTPEAPRLLVPSATTTVATFGGYQSYLGLEWWWSRKATNGTSLDSALSHFDVQYRLYNTDTSSIDANVMAWKNMPAVDGMLWETTHGPVDYLDSYTRNPATYELRVRAVAENGNASEWSEVVTIAVPVDEDAPLTPTRPSAWADGSVLFVSWDGMNATGGSMPADFSHARVQEAVLPPDAPEVVSDTYLNALTWTDVNEYPVSAPGSTPIFDRTVGTRYSYRIIAVDRAGNASEPGAGAAPVSPISRVDSTEFDAAMEAARQENQAAQQELDGKLATNSGLIATAQADIDALELRSDGIQQDLDAAEAQLAQAALDIDAAEVRIGQAETDLAAADQRIATEEQARAAAVQTLQAKDTELETSLASTEAKASQAATDLIALDGRLDTAEASLSTAEANISALSSRATTAESDITAAEARLTQAESDLTTTAGELSTLSGDVGAIETRVTSVESVAATAQSDAAAAGTAAEEAAAAALAAQRKVDALTAAADSLVIGGDFEQELEAFAQYRIQPTSPYSGTWALQLSTSTYHNIIFPRVTVRPGMELRGSLVARRYPNDTGGQKIFLAYRLHKSDGTSEWIYRTPGGGVEPELTATWQTWEFAFPPLPEGAVAIEPRLYNTGEPFGTSDIIVDSASMVDISSYKAAMEAATAAQQAAEDAAAEANDAYQLANTAQQAANGKNFVVYQLTEPQGVGLVDGDTWYQVNDLDEGIIIGHWNWNATDGVWEPKLVDGAQVANFDAGYITSGYLDVANRIQAGSLSADKVMIGVGSNMIPWSMVAAGENVGPHIAYGDNSHPPTLQSPSSTGDMSPWHLLFKNDTPGTASRYIGWIASGGQHANGSGRDFLFEEGRTYHFSMGVRLGGSYLEGHPSVRVQVGCRDAGGAIVDSTVSAYHQVTWDPTTLTFDFTPPAGTQSFYLLIQTDRPGALRVIDPSLRVMSDGALIVNGSITGSHVDAESVAAEVGEFVQVKAANVEVTSELSTRVFTASDAAARNLVVTGSTTLDGETWARDLAAEEITAASIDVEQLDVTGTGNFKQAVVDQLWADTFATHKISTEELMVGTGANLYPDPRFEHPEAFGSYSTSVYGPGTGRNGNGSFLLPSSTTQRGSYAGLGDERFMIPVTPGAEYRIGAWVRTATDVMASNGAVLYARAYSYADGTWSFTDPSFVTVEYDASTTIFIPRNVWTLIHGIVKIPDGKDQLAIGFYANSSYDGAVRFSDPFVQQATGSVLIADGAVTAEKVAASQGIFEKIYASESVTARKGVFTDGLQAMDPTFLGTTTADALNLTGTLQGRDAIFNGSLDVEQLNVTESMATEIFTASNASVRNLVVTGSTTLDGETWARDLAAEEITAATIKVDQLTVTGSANMDTAVAEEFWARKIAAKKILAQEVIIGAGYNLVANGMGEMKDGTNFSRFARNTSPGTHAGTPAVESYWTYSTSGLAIDNRFSVVGGRTYKGSAYTRGQYDGQSCFMQMRFYGADGSYLTNPSPWSSYMFSNKTANSTEWSYYEGEIVAPAGAVEADIVLYGNHNYGVQNANQWHRWAAIQVIEMTEGSLIVDGAVKANHFDADTFNVNDIITAHKIEADSIEVDQVKNAIRVDSYLFDGQVYYGGRFEGSTFVTPTVNNAYVAMDHQGIYAYDTNNELTFWINAANGKVAIAGEYRSGWGYEPTIIISNADSSWNGVDQGIWFTNTGDAVGWNNANGYTPSAGIFTQAAGNVAYPLELRGYGTTNTNGGVRIWEQLEMRSFYSSTANIRALGGANLNVASANNMTLDSGFKMYIEANSDIRLTPGSSGRVQFGQDGWTGYNQNGTGTALVIDNNGNIFRNSSSIRYKTEVHRYSGDDRIFDLTPNTWVSKDGLERAKEMREKRGPLTEMESRELIAAEQQTKRQVGFIAEDLHELGFTEVVNYDLEGKPDSIQYDRLLALVWPFIQEMWAEHKARKVQAPQGRPQA